MGRRGGTEGGGFVAAVRQVQKTLQNMHIILSSFVYIVSSDDLITHIFQDFYWYWDNHINGLVQDCSISIVNALETLQSCAKPSISLS